MTHLVYKIANTLWTPDEGPVHAGTKCWNVGIWNCWKLHKQSIAQNSMVIESLILDSSRNSSLQPRVWALLYRFATPSQY
jgi:hypothetical protein